MIQPLAAEHLDELLAAFHAEQDRGVRCWLLELIGDARHEKALPVLVEQLGGAEESFRDWAIRGLEQLGTKEARIALHRHRANNTY